MLKAVVIIPARYDASRFPGKVLTNINGKPMIQWVYEGAKRAKLASNVIIATDSELVYDEMTLRNIDVEMTGIDHQSGTDRCAELAAKLDADIIVNVQGDEPLIDGSPIDALIQSFVDHPNQQIATLIRKEEDEVAIDSSHVVKVVTRTDGRALYFSRSKVPFIRNKDSFDGFWRHVGIYAFKRETLMNLSQLSVSLLESTEGLEQLRWLEAGYDIQTIKTDHVSVGVDIPDDLKKVRDLL